MRYKTVRELEKRGINVSSVTRCGHMEWKSLLLFVPRAFTDRDISVRRNVARGRALRWLANKLARIAWAVSGGRGSCLRLRAR